MRKIESKGWEGGILIKGEDGFGMMRIPRYMEAMAVNEWLICTVLTST